MKDALEKKILELDEQIANIRSQLDDEPEYWTFGDTMKKIRLSELIDEKARIITSFKFADLSKAVG